MIMYFLTLRCHQEPKITNELINSLSLTILKHLNLKLKEGFNHCSTTSLSFIICLQMTCKNNFVLHSSVVRVVGGRGVCWLHFRFKEVSQNVCLMFSYLNNIFSEAEIMWIDRLFLKKMF